MHTYYCKTIRWVAFFLTKLSQCRGTTQTCKRYFFPLGQIIVPLKISYCFSLAFYKNTSEFPLGHRCCYGQKSPTAERFIFPSVCGCLRKEEKDEQNIVFPQQGRNSTVCCLAPSLLPKSLGSRSLVGLAAICFWVQETEVSHARMNVTHSFSETAVGIHYLLLPGTSVTHKET